MKMINQRYGMAVGKTMFWALGGLTCIVAAGCENSTVTRHESIFPLSPGTSWHFSPGGGDSILGLVEINGQCYSEFLSSPVVGPPYLREDEKQQVVFWNGSEDQVLFNFEAAVRDSWQIDLGFEDFTLRYTVTLVSKKTTLTVPAGTFENCYRFDFTSTDVIDGNWIVAVAPNVGVVFQKGGFGFTIELESYNISSREGCKK